MATLVVDDTRSLSASNWVFYLFQEVLYCSEGTETQFDV